MCLDGVPGFGRASARVGNVHAVCSEGPGRDDVARQAALRACVLPQDQWLRVWLRVCGSDLGPREPAPSLVAGNPIQHLSAWAGVGAHLCARALPGEPHRAQVRSYNNRGAVGSRSPWLTALPPGPAWPVASGLLLAGRSAPVREGVTGRATSRTGALLQQPWCCRLEISRAHSTSASAHRCWTSGAVSRAPGATARASRASGIWPSISR
ncbi:hypothetical protein XA1311A_03350 [Xanthomonas arboricola]|nr:hypothetical protein XA1311A_03350 [Xanthomonas arboricola]CAE6697735.1 hypothetical protein XA1311A_03350 [Xanthomonas arboricola]